MNKDGVFYAGFGENCASLSHSGQTNANFNRIHTNLLSQIPSLIDKHSRLNVVNSEQENITGYVTRNGEI